MHLVTKSYFDSFVEKNQLSLEPTKAFEAFGNFCVFSKFSADSIDPLELIYEGDDPGVDGALVFLDDRLISSVEELMEIMASTKREFDVRIVLVQVKSSESWNKMQIDSFVANSVDLLSENPAQPHSEYLKNFRDVFLELFKNIGRVRGGLPTLSAFFVSAGDTPQAVEIKAAFDVGYETFKRTGLFQSLSFDPIDRNEIHSLWLSSSGSIEATLPTIGYAPFPEVPNVTDAYVATVSARNFVDKVLKDEAGAHRKRLFEENVRDFLGIDADVNSEIAETLNNEERKSRFGLMNNGITIVAPEVRPAGQNIFIRDFQIVNGCQTSNMLINFDHLIDNSVSLMVKLVKADDAEIVDDIVRATNRQSKVEDAQFASTLAFLRTIETYFVAKGGSDANRLYFERRKGQYRNENVPALRLFDVRETARCYAATGLLRPDISSRYPNRLTAELLNEVYSRDVPENAYYSSCFALYRVKILTSNRRLDTRYSKLRWHILTAISQYCRLTKARRADLFDEIANLFNASTDESFSKLSRIIEVAIPDPDISRDVLKGQSLTQNIFSNLQREYG